MIFSYKFIHLWVRVVLLFSDGSQMQESCFDSFSPMLGLMSRPRSLVFQSSFPVSLSPSVCTLPLLFHPQTALRNSLFSLSHTRREVLEVVASELLIRVRE